MNIETIPQLLDHLKKIPAVKPNDPTFMEIAGYPHYENVCSNILEFFLNPDYPHGLKSLFIKALIGCENEPSNVKVEREAGTDSGNRIDILIETDTHVIIIENKIFHGINNPLEDYTEFINKRNKDGKKPIKFILGLNDIKGNISDFTPITYANYFAKIRSMMGEYILQANPKYLGLLIDFMNTINNLQKGSPMNEGFLELVRNREADIISLFDEVKEFKSELRKKIIELGSKINKENKSVPINQYYYRENMGLSDDLVHDIQLANEMLVSIDTWLTANDWIIFIWIRKGYTKDKLEEIRKFLMALSINCEYRADDSTVLDYPNKFSYNEPLDNIQPHLQNLIDILVKYKVTP